MTPPGSSPPRQQLPRQTPTGWWWARLLWQRRCCQRRNNGVPSSRMGTMARARTTSVDCTTSCRRGDSSQGAPASRTPGLGPTTRGGVGDGGPGSLPSAPPPRPLTKRGHRSVRNPQRERAAGSRHPLGTAPAGSLTPWTSLSQSQARIPVSQMRTLQF